MRFRTPALTGELPLGMIHYFTTFWQLRRPDHHLNLCKGTFSGNTRKPGYLLLRKLADAMLALVHGSPWRLEIGGWERPLGAARLTVGPGGGWVFSENNVSTRFGSP